jgi:hypothetical protein
LGNRHIPGSTGVVMCASRFGTAPMLHVRGELLTNGGARGVGWSVIPPLWTVSPPTSALPDR